MQEEKQHTLSADLLLLLVALIWGFGFVAQRVGIQHTTAGKAGFITGLYVVLVPMIGLAFGQRTTAGTWIGTVAAAIGLYLLSVTEDFRIEPGDLLVLIGAVFWAGHVLILAYLSPRTVPVRRCRSSTAGSARWARAAGGCWARSSPAEP